MTTTDPATAGPTVPPRLPDAFDLDRAWRLHERVALRPETFGAPAYHFGTRRLSFLKDPTLARVGMLQERTLARAPATVRADLWHLVDDATAHDVGVKFSTNGSRIDDAVAARLAASDYVDVQISLDGSTAEVNDAIRGDGSYATAMRAMERLAAAGFEGFKISVVMTRHNVRQLDEFKAIADRFKAQLRVTRLRPSGRGADVWDELHPTADQERELYDWLVAHGEDVLTGDSFFHLAAYGVALPGLNLRGGTRGLIDPIGDVYACPFAIHDEFLAGNVRRPGGFTHVWRGSELFADLRHPQTSGACTSCEFFDSCRGGCMAAKFFTGLPKDGPDPECVRGFGEEALSGRDGVVLPQASQDHSRIPAGARSLPIVTAVPDRAGDESPLAGFRPIT